MPILAVEEIVLLRGIGMRRRSQQAPQPLLPLLDVEMMLVLQRAPQHR